MGERKRGTLVSWSENVIRRKGERERDDVRGKESESAKEKGESNFANERIIQTSLLLAILIHLLCNSFRPPLSTYFFLFHLSLPSSCAMFSCVCMCMCVLVPMHLLYFSLSSHSSQSRWCTPNDFADYGKPFSPKLMLLFPLFDHIDCIERERERNGEMQSRGKKICPERMNLCMCVFWYIVIRGRRVKSPGSDHMIDVSSVAGKGRKKSNRFFARSLDVCSDVLSHIPLSSHPSAITHTHTADCSTDASNGRGKTFPKSSLPCTCNDLNHAHLVSLSLSLSRRCSFAGTPRLIQRPLLYGTSNIDWQGREKSD